MPLRAENLPLETLLQVREYFDQRNKIYRDPLSRLYHNLSEFFSDRNPFLRRFQLGVKGWGKTLSTLLALNKFVTCNHDKIPLLFIFNKASRKIEVYNPLRLASRDVWTENRLEFFNQTPSNMLDQADLIVLDDIHYVFEHIMYQPNYFPVFLELLKRVLLRSTNGTKTLLISEEQLFMYADVLQNKDLDTILRKFGLTTTWQVQYEDHRAIDVPSFREFVYWSFRDWCEYASVYGELSLESTVAFILYQINSSPRAFLKLAKLFKAEEQITMQMLFDSAMQRLQKESRIKEATLRFYETLFRELPLLSELPSDLETYERILLSNAIDPSLATRELNDTAKYLTRCFLRDHIDLKSDRPHFNTPLFVLRRAMKKFHPIDFKAKIETYLRESHFHGSYYHSRKEIPTLATSLLAIIKYRLKFPWMRRAKNLFEKLQFLGLSYRQIKGRYRDGVLFEPFERAFGDFLKERPSLTYMYDFTKRGVR